MRIFSGQSWTSFASGLRSSLTGKASLRHERYPPRQQGGVGTSSMADFWKTYLPPGTVLVRYDSTSPASIYGGTWQQITGRFLRAASDVSTGGSDTFSIAVGNLPAHSHGLNGHAHSYTKATGVNNHTLSVAQMPSHTHNTMDLYGRKLDDLPSMNLYQVPITGVTNQNKQAVRYTGGGAAHKHGLSTVSASTGGNSGSTTNTGSGTSINWKPPYQDVYVWRRVS